MKFEVVESEDWDGVPEVGGAEPSADPSSPTDTGEGGPGAGDPARDRIERIAEHVNSQVKADIATTRAALGKLWATVAATNTPESDPGHTEESGADAPPAEFRPCAFSPAPPAPSVPSDDESEHP